MRRVTEPDKPKKINVNFKNFQFSPKTVLDKVHSYECGRISSVDAYIPFTMTKESEEVPKKDPS